MKIIEDLNVYKKAMMLSVQIYKTTKCFPEEEKFGLVSQMRRASVSIVSNLSEGGARISNGEFKQFLGIARGSVSELKTQLILSKNLGFNICEYDNILADIVEIHRMIIGLIKSLETK